MISRQKSIFGFGLFLLSILFFSRPTFLAGQSQITPFLISPNQNMSGALECPFITFQTWDGSIWTAWIKGDHIVTAPNGNIFAVQQHGSFRYINPEGKPIEAKLVSGKLVHTLKGDGSPIGTADSICYLCWDGRPLFAKLLPPTSSPVTAATGTATSHVGPRFTFADGEVTDWKTDLIWKPGPDKDTSFNEAQTWISSLGAGWRRPSQAELKNIFSRGEGGGLKGNMPSVFPRMNGTIVWAEENDKSTAWYVGFIYANGYSLSRENPRFARAFAVRPR